LSDTACPYVLDASALLALLHREAGADVVLSAIGNAAISTVNWSEVLKKAIERGVSIEGMREDLEALGLQIVLFTVEQAEAAAQLYPTTKPLGLSLGDRACLVLGLELGAVTLTADQIWSELGLCISIQLIR
jgi:PIN domain nuclease of toxin-antitoxin system